MNDILAALSEIQTDLPWRAIALGLVLVLVSQIFLKFIDRVFLSLIEGWKEKGQALSARKFFIYSYNLVAFLLFLKIIRVEMKVILGATGLLTIAIGFAARTPISNLISGIFLIFEKPFVVGDIIEINGFTGEVVSRNLLSLTLRTLDNLMVRIPNEMVIGTSVSNVSYFPIRRLDIKYLISNKESITRFENLFKDVASRNALALNEPSPYFYVNEFRQNCIEVMFTVWSSSDDFFKFRSEFPKEIHRAVKAAGLELILNRVEFVSPINLADKESPQK